MSGPVALLGADGRSTRIVRAYLARFFEISTTIIEPPVPAAEIARRRAKRLGLARTGGQMAFQLLVGRSLERTSRHRIDAILAEHQLEDPALPARQVDRVNTVNGPACRALLRAARPAVVIINGTRIISPQTLGAVDAPFLNMHAGITPRYRGVHGGYWALAEGDPEHAGVTVHYVDRGIDTGGITSQARIQPTDRDNFATYPYLQLAAGLPLLREAAEAILAGDPPEPKPGPGPSRLRSHPTLLQYVRARWQRGVK